NAEEYDRTYTDGQLVGRIANYFKPHMRTVLLVSAMVILMSIGATITPILVSSGLNYLSDRPELGLLLGLAAIVTVLGILNWCFTFVRQIFSARAVGDVVLALRSDAF